MSAIDQLSQRYWDLSLEANPSNATLLGDHRFDHLLEDLSPEFLDKTATQLREVMTAAAAIDTGAFDPQQRITQAMLLSEASDALTMIETRVMVASPDPLIGPANGVLMYAGQTAAQDATQAEALREDMAWFLAFSPKPSICTKPKWPTGGPRLRQISTAS